MYSDSNLIKLGLKYMRFPNSKVFLHFHFQKITKK